MNNNGSTRIIAILGALMLLPLTSLTAGAEIIILSSNAPSLKSGQVLADNAALNIPAGKSAQLILPSGKTKTLKGPFNGTVASLSKGKTSDTSLFKKLMSVVKKNGRDDSGYAAVRRVGRPAIGGLKKFSWTAIPADITGTFCVAEGEQLELLRPRNISVKTLTMRNPDTKKKATVTWNTGQKSTLWPDHLLPKSDSRFAFKLAEANERSIQFKLVAREAQSNEDVLRTLHKRGCQKQLEAWLKERLKN